jgi:integrase
VDMSGQRAPMTVEVFGSQWLREQAARLAPQTWRSYTAAFQHHIVPALGGLVLGELTVQIIRRWLRDELMRGRKRNSVRAYHTVLSSLLTDAVIDGHLDTNVAHGAGRRLYPARGEGVTKVLTPTDLASVLRAARLIGPRWAHDAIALGAKTGLRLGELVGLGAEHVLLEDGALRIEHSYRGSGEFGPTKNGKARLVECSPATVQLLARLVDQAAGAGRWLFPGRHERQPLAPAVLTRTFGTVAAAVQLPPTVTFHALRHTYASVLLAKGAPAQWVQQQLGHAHYAITVDLYGSWLRQRRPDLTALLDEEPGRHGPLGLERRGQVIPLPHRRR